VSHRDEITEKPDQPTSLRSAADRKRWAKIHLTPRNMCVMLSM
jgi:hypothetical protein